MSDPIMLHGLLMIVGVFVAPALGFVLFFLWLEQKELMDQNVTLQERLRATQEALNVAWTDGFDAARDYGERAATQAWVEGYEAARHLEVGA